MFWILIGLLLATLIWFSSRKENYWAKQGVKQKNVFVLNDLFRSIYMKKNLQDFVLDSYNEFPNSRYNGMYQFSTPLLLVRDIDLIKQITVKDFDYFTDHFNFISDDNDQLWTSNLFALKGEKWRDMRATLSPAFTGSKMRAMFVLMSECAQEVTKYFENHTEERKSIELRDLFTRYTNDVIATCAFGVQCNSIKEKENEFYLMGKLLTDFTGFRKIINIIILMLIPKIGKVLGISFFDKRVETFFRRIIKSTIKMREEHNIQRPDMINLLMEARKGRLGYEETSATQDTGFATVEESEIGKTVKKVKVPITDETITSQALLFFFAGFDTVATLMVMMGYELAINPDVQERLQREIAVVFEHNGGAITYEVMNKMKYLDMVISETLRKWPASVGRDRVCVKPYTIAPVLPDENPVTLNVGDVISLPVYGIHRDPKLYPNPEKFDPERFNDENKVNINSKMYLPFGSGPRNCIGSRFALIEAKIIFVHLLAKFNIIRTEKSEVPVKIRRRGINYDSVNGYWFGLELRN